MLRHRIGGGRRRLSETSSTGLSDAAKAGEPAYPLGPRFAGPRQGLARDSAPSIPEEGPRSAAACVFAQRRTGSDRWRSRAAWRLRSRSMPVPDAVHVRVRATDCCRNPVGGVLRRALTRAVTMTVRRSAGDAPPARCVGSGATSWGIEGGRSIPSPGRNVQHGVGWLTHLKGVSQPTARGIRRSGRGCRRSARSLACAHVQPHSGGPPVPPAARSTLQTACQRPEGRIIGPPSGSPVLDRPAKALRYPNTYQQ